MYERLLALAILMTLSPGCSEDVVCTGQDRTIVTPLWESGLAVQDTSDARAVITAYDAFVRDTGGSFPDMSEGWVYVSSSLSHVFHDIKYWNVFYKRTDDGAFGNGNVYVSESGDVVLLDIFIHSPCPPRN